ncbi:hypothetical protein OG21DRAFT_1594769 [Imleria badia]|nr:hypothetical protein OG21DRAFT_1594769 [Imleria badia]
MDELVHHCLRELSFDGDLGCNVSRLRDFIAGFYSSQDVHSQRVDDTICAFVWSLVVQQPSVRVGTLPPGSISEVYIAPQTSAKRKAVAKGEELTEGVPPSLVLVEDARHRHLEDLRREYGDDLRIAVDPETSFAAITGSHIRPPKLSPMVYSALQLITRGREDGITTVDLGRKTKYDQKTCFYLIKQLVELGLIIKARRGGVGNHTCIHKYFVERSPLWQQIQEEEARDGGEHIKLRDTADEPTDQDGPSQILFDPIDSRHLSSLPLVKNRIIKLLKASKNHIHQSNNLLITIGFVHPTKTDRRFFQTRLRELIQQGVVERVLVPSSKTRDRTIKCIRLVASDNKLPEGSVVVGQDVEDDEKDASLAEDASAGHNEVKTNLTVHKQVSNMLEEAGPSGLTLNEICVSLGNFDKRTIELLLTRASNNRPPAHLGDLGTVDLMETYGRERRHRYFTFAAYKCVMASEGLQDTTTSTIDVDLSRAGDFAALDPTHFYTTTGHLHSHQDSFKDIATAKGKKRKRDEEGGNGEESEPVPKPKRGRPRKTPALTDASTVSPKKRGRPRKNPLAKDVKAPSAASGGSPSKPTADVYAVGEGQAVADAPFEQNAQQSTSTTADRSSVIHLAKQPACVPPASRPSERCDGEAGISHPESDKGVGDAQSYQSNKTPSRRSSERAGRTAALNADYHSITKPRDDDAIVSGSHSLERDELQGKSSSASVAQEEETAGMSAICNPMQTTGQESPQTPSRDVGTGEKHKYATLPPSSRPSKRSRTNGGGKSRSNINISSLRRENELLKVIESMGGIANMQSKEIFDAHTALLETMSQAKEPTSAPVGTRLDKRTAESTLKNLENHGRIRMVKTSLVAPSVSRPTCLVYLPDTPQEKVNAFLRHLSQSVPSTTMASVKVLEPIEYGPDVSSARHVSLPLNLLQIEDQDEKEDERLKQLFSYDNKTIRDVLLTERTTVAQLYGFVVGKALRLRQLHLRTLDLFQQSSPSPFVISREHRIIDISHFHQDITLALHCSLVAVVAHDEELDLLFSGQGKQTVMKNLSPNLHTSLGIGKSRNRSRVLELLELLRSLGLVTPLERTEAHDAPFKCSSPKGDTIAFQNASLEGWSASTPALAPLFWRFNTSGSLYLWALSESSPSYWKEHPTRTPTEGEAYWDELRKVSREQAYAQAAACPSTSPPMPAKMSTSLGRCLRRRSSWDPEYALTWHQKQYMAMQMDMKTGTTPLNAEDVDAKLDQICNVISVPRQVVANYFTVSGEKLTGDLEKARMRIKRNRKAEEAQSIEGKSALRKKAEEARAQRERDWDVILRRLHPEPVKGTLAVRIRAVRSRFMQSTITKDQPHWENEIQEAIKEARLVSKKIVSQPKAKFGTDVHTPVSGPPPVVPNPPEKSIEFLITQQGSPITQTASVKKKGKAKEESEASRRPRFHWTREFDELARDASAIIRARCRASRLDLSAFDQVFPAVPRNSVRQRITHLRDNAAEDLYMKRLEDQWYSIWLQYRGTPHLPDEDPGSPSNFNLINHIEFLRKHVDKNALRVGFVEREAPSKLVISVEELHDFYEVREDIVPAPSWDFMWGTTVEEGREKQFRSQAFTKEPDSMYESTKDEKVQLAEAALKMVFGTPSELYDSDSATRLLHSAGDQCVSVARSNLLHQGVLSKLVRDPKKQKPGRMLKISDANLNGLGGPFPRDLFQDAVSLEDVAIERVVDEMEWPLIASEGDIATLLQLISEDQVDFTVDLSQSRVARQKIDWNSKRADDEDIETSIRLRFSRTSVAGPGGDQCPESPAVEPEVNTLGQEIHETTLDGKEAACTLKAETGLINCSACIDTAFATFTSSLGQSDRDLARRTLGLARSSRETGLNKATCLGLEVELEQRILWLVHRMTLTSPPILLWTYFNAPMLVAADYCDAWSVAVSDGPLTLITPRRWLDIRGYRLDGPWRAAQQAVVGVVFLHPGISQAELRWRLRAVYDRQEIVDLLSSLQQDSVLEYRTDASVETIQSLPGWLKTIDNEEIVFWFIAKNHHWYQF